MSEILDNEKIKKLLIENYEQVIDPNSVVFTTQIYNKIIPNCKYNITKKIVKNLIRELFPFSYLQIKPTKKLKTYKTRYNYLAAK